MISSNKRASYAIRKAERVGDALVLASDRGILELRPQNESILRIRYTELEALSEEYGLGICFKGSFSGWQYAEDADCITVALPKLTAKVSKATGSIRYFAADGTLLLRERDFQSKYVSYFDAVKTVIDENTVVEEVVTPDGVKKRIGQATVVFDRRLCHTKLSLEFQPDERIFGLGQSPEGTLDLRGTTQYLHQANMKIAIPFFLSTAGYGILSATDGAAIFSDGEHGSYLYTDADREMDFYFIGGPEMDDIIKGYRFLTGKAVMLPKWAFGFIQSQERYETQQEVLSIADGFAERGLGLDCLVLDWNTWLPGHWGEKQLDPAAFPNVPEMVRRLEEQNVHLMLSIWANPAENTVDYGEFLAKDCLLPACTNYDPFKPEARSLYWQQVKRGVFDKGIKAFWCDSSEPFTPEWVLDEPEVSVMYHEYIAEVSKFMPRDRINAYALAHARSIYDGQRGETDRYRVCNLTRSAHTGSQRYGVILWSGDISASWDVYRKQIAAGLNFCASGLPFWTLDIGAFFVKRGEQWFWNGDYDNTSDDPAYRELFARWFQLGAFLPVFRSHGTDVRREPWNFGQEGEPVYDAIKGAIELRYRLIPYIYSAAADVYRNDGTVMRMLAFDYRTDRTATAVRDQYLFGKSIMVCPVTTPMEPDGQPTVRRVYLPAGNDWYDFYTMERFAGGQWIEVSVTLAQIPLFVKAGSIIPMTKPVRNTAESGRADIEYRVFPGADAAFTLYEDDGDGYACENGGYTLTEVRWNDAEQKLTVKKI